MLTLGEVISAISAIIAVIAVVVNIRKNSTESVSRKIEWERTQENRITQLESQMLRMTPVNDRVVALETKMGLFWNLVEEYMTKFVPPGNPIQFTDEEEQAIAKYKQYKSHTRTPTLRIIEAGIEREFARQQDIPSDEVFFYFLILNAVKAQLIDRGEPVHSVPGVNYSDERDSNSTES